MKTLKASTGTKQHLDRYYDPEVLKQLDIEQGRRRLTWREVDGVIALLVARQLITDASEALSGMSRDVGAYNGIKSAEGHLKRALGLLRDKISGSQLISIANNVNDCDVSISANPVCGDRQMINIDRQHMQHIVNQACRGCDYTCTCNREESRMCELRRALDCVPGVKKQAKQDWNDHTKCPYQMFEMED